MNKKHSFAYNKSRGVIFLNLFKKQKKCDLPNRVTERATNIISMQNKQTDPNGSYTGVPENPNDKPVQDADDL